MKIFQLLSNLLIDFSSLESNQQSGRLIYKDCSSSNSIIKNYQMEWDPNPPIVGKLIDQTVTGYVTREVSSKVLFKTTLILKGKEIKSESILICEDDYDEEKGVCFTKGALDETTIDIWKNDFPKDLLGMKFIVFHEENEVFCGILSQKSHFIEFQK